MAKPDALTQEAKKMPRRKLVRKLEKARDSQQRAERKVGKLRARLEQAEVRLAQRTLRVSMVQERLQPPLEVTITAAGLDSIAPANGAPPTLRAVADGAPPALQAVADGDAHLAPVGDEGPAAADDVAKPAPARALLPRTKGAQRHGHRARGNSSGTIPASPQ